MPHLFCFGLGYSALTLADRLLAQGWSVSGTCRSEDKAQRLRARGIRVHLFGPGQPAPDPAAELADVTHILSSVPPDADGDPGLRAYGAALGQQRGLDWVGYLSTTGVYGDRGGGWVDEESALLPTGERGQRRVDAEAAWRGIPGLAVHVFRLAGIYGPGSNALETVRAGRAQRIDKPGQVFSRIHVDDIATVLEASIRAPNPGAIYNVCDDNPAPPEAVIRYACDLLGVTPPPAIPFDQAILSPMAASFYADNKRVSNRRMKEELGVQLRWPDYRLGLQALL